MRLLLGITILLMLILSGCASGSQPPDPFITGRGVYGNLCSVCHGDAGQGLVGPSLKGVNETFPSCDDQVQWITLGSTRWQGEIGDRYGATSKPVAGGMPSMESELTADEIVAVAAFERSQFGGIPRDEALEQCGFTATPTTQR